MWSRCPHGLPLFRTTLQDNDMQPTHHPGAKLYKPRREFRAWLIHELNKRGADLPANPEYTRLREAVERLLLGDPR